MVDLCVHGCTVLGMSRAPCLIGYKSMGDCVLATGVCVRTAHVPLTDCVRTAHQSGILIRVCIFALIMFCCAYRASYSCILRTVLVLLACFSNCFNLIILFPNHRNIIVTTTATADTSYSTALYEYTVRTRNSTGYAPKCSSNV